MDEKFVPIELTEIKNDYGRLLNNKFNVILGSPGSGKTFLAKYLSKNFDGKYLTVKDFMDEDEEYLINDKTNLFILDGFDEYRIFEKSKNFTIKQFARKIRNLLSKKEFKVILTCRELDWYGDDDSNAIKDILNFDVKLYYIEPLTKEKLKEFIKAYNIENEDKLYLLFEKGFINTPQLFKISKNILSKDISNKIDLYEEYILFSTKEINPYHKEKNNKLSNEEILEFLGYIAYFYMFSDIENFNEEIIAEMASQKYNIKIIEQLLKSKIFKENRFIHRTIAEFLCGRYLANLIMNNFIDKSLIISKFRNKNFIYTELRATYAWLCAITGDFDLIKIDPYYQLIYGENNHFSIEFKKKILEAIKDYSSKNPNFIDTNSYFFKNELAGFYEKDEKFDEFLIKEFEEAINLENHYIYVFEMIFTSNQDKLSLKIKNFLFEKMFDNKLVINVKKRLIQSDIFSIEQNKKILEAVKKNKIIDEDNILKRVLLEKMNSYLTVDEIVLIFKLFEKSNLMDICYFLYEMDWDKKKELVLKIEKEIFQKNRRNYKEIFDRWICLKRFLENFYFELFHTGDGKEIYEFLKKVRKFYKNYEEIKIDKGYINRNIKERSKEELQQLANELFEFYFNDLSIDKNIFSKIFYFRKWFPLAYPTNIAELVLEKIENINDKAIQKELFWIAMRHWRDKNSFNEIFNKLAKNFNLEKELNQFKYPEKNKYELEEEQLKKEIEQERKEIIQKNNKFFSNLTKNNFFQHFNALKLIADLIFLEKENINDYLDISLFEKFKNYFSEFIFSGNFMELVSVEKFAENLKSFSDIDEIFYASLFLSERNDEIFYLDKKFLKYLYLLSLRYQNMYINNKWFIEQFEKKKFELAKEAIIQLFQYKFNLSKNLKKRINVASLEKLKELFNLIYSDDNFVNCYIKTFNFSIKKSEINELKDIKNTDLLEVFEKFINRKFLTQDELVVLYINIFDNHYKKQFDNLPENLRLQLIENFLIVFDDKSKMPFHSGAQSNLDITRSFVRFNLLEILTEKEIKILLTKDISDYWKNLLKWKLVKLEETSHYKSFRIKELKNFIEKRGLLNEKDFFEYISLKMDELIKKIEANENNEKDFFYDNNKPKNENKCRDAFVNWFEDTFFYFIDREKYIGNDRADFAVNSKINEWEIRVECKKDKNNDLFDAIKTQLIEQYLENKLAQFGIYLVFYFKDRKKNIDYIKEKIKENIPNDWKNNIKIKIINLTKA